MKIISNTPSPEEELPSIVQNLRSTIQTLETDNETGTKEVYEKDVEMNGDNSCQVDGDSEQPIVRQLEQIKIDVPAECEELKSSVRILNIFFSGNFFKF